MEIPYFTLVCASQVLILWLPMVLATCQEELSTLALGDVQKFPHIKENMYVSCADLLRGETEECSIDCDDKVQKMLDMYQGSHVFFTCDCSGPIPIYPESECLNVQERLAVCPSLVRSDPTQPTAAAMDSTTPTILQDGRVPCVAARRRCHKKTDCVSQLQTTISSCEGLGCDEGCQRELDILFVQGAAQDLWQCTGCDDGNEDGWCDLVKRCTAVQAQSEGTVVPYKPEGTAKPSDDTGDGRAEKSVKPLRNTARPLCPFLSSHIELLIISAILRIAFF